MNIIIHGSTGRMGRALLACSANYSDIAVVGEIHRNSINENWSQYEENCILRADVVVDFSIPAATPVISEICASYKKAIVIGTTGHNRDQLQYIKRHANFIPIVMASNFSIGVNVLFVLVREAAKILGPGFDLEIIEMHHRFKKDAPSGTAKTLTEILKDVRDRQIAKSTDLRQFGTSTQTRNGREGITGERPRNEIGIHSVRGGDVVGDHTVIFAGDGERVELTHKASSRDAFANGALLAAEWVVHQKPGFYDMQDVLGLPK
ncbi:MAG: 4-hydroxy-tetrahydrodipicolinate reductase [Candidatus Taylorbacteria bacterium]